MLLIYNYIESFKRSCFVLTGVFDTETTKMLKMTNS